MKVPRSWSIVPLSDVAAKGRNAIVDGPFGSNLKLSDYVEDGVPVLQGKNITGNTFQWFDIRFVSEEKANALRRSLVRVGDILIVKIGSIGYSAVLDDLHGYPYALIPANLCKITPNMSIIDRNYLAYYLTSEAGVEYLKANASATSQPALSLGKLKKLPVPLPPLPEQQRIAAVLARADRLRRLRRYALDLGDGYLQSVFLKMFGDPVTNPMGWEVVNLGAALNVITYGLTVRPKYMPSGFPLISAREIRSGSVDFDNAPRISESDFRHVSDKGKPKRGDILFSKTGAIGHCAEVKTDRQFAITQNAARLSFKNDLLVNAFALHYLRSSFIQGIAEHEAKGNAVQDLQLGVMKRFPLYLPPLSVQQQFARVVHQFERLRAQQREAQRQAEHLFQTLLHRAFQGELVKT